MKTKSLAYNELVPILIKAVQDEQAEIEQLKAWLAALEAAQGAQAASPVRQLQR